MERWRQELYHHGIKGQKWGVRRFQNENGSLTSKGRARYDTQNQSVFRRVAKNQAIAGAISGVASVGTAAATAAGVSALAKRGRMDEATKLYIAGKRATRTLKAYSGVSALSAGVNYRLARAFEVDYKNYGKSSKKTAPKSTNAPNKSKQTAPKQDQSSKSDKSKINKKKVAVGAAVVAGSALAAYGAVKYKKVSGAKSAQTAHKVGEAAKLVSNVSSHKPSGATKVASAAKSASKPIMSFSGKDTGFTQTDMERMLDNLGKMSEIARNGQDIVRNL